MAQPPNSDAECLTADTDSHTDQNDWDTRLARQLIIQQELYTFFGTASKDQIKRYLLFASKGSIFFHGDNIKQNEMMSTEIIIAENVSIDENHKYKIKTVNIDLTAPTITFSPKISNEDEQTISQASALLSKASQLRLKSNMEFNNKTIMAKYSKETKWSNGIAKFTSKTNATPDEVLLVNFINNINPKLSFIYDNSEPGLMQKLKDGFDVFDRGWTASQNNAKYKVHSGNFITDTIIKDKITEKDRLVEAYITAHPTEKADVQKYVNNYIGIQEMLSKPEDEFLKPPAKTQFFGNPCAETNIVLASGDENNTKGTNCKYLYTMQVYMFQKDIYILDYNKLLFIYTDHPAIFQHRLGYTGINKRSFHWKDYFKQTPEDLDNIDPGIYTLPFPINTDINNNSITANPNIAQPIKDHYAKPYQYILRNSQALQDSPVITHLNYILSLRGFNINIEASSDFDLAELYPNITDINPIVADLYTDDTLIQRMYGGIVCREYTITNATETLLFLCSASTLPNYNINNLYTDDNRTFIAGNITTLTTLNDTHNIAASSNTQMHLNFTDPKILTNIHNKHDINILQNSFKYKKKNFKLIHDKYTNLNDPVALKNGKPQFSDLALMIEETYVRRNIYTTIINQLNKIKYTRNGQLYKLTMYDNKKFNPKDEMHCLKLVFIKDGQNLTYTNHDNNNLLELTNINYSNFINNVNFGKFSNGYNNNNNVFDGVNFSTTLYDTADTTDIVYNKLDGAIFDLVRYNHNCPNNWETNEQMTVSEKTTCHRIAEKITKSNNRLLTQITEINPNNNCTRQDCLKRINKLRTII